MADEPYKVFQTKEEYGDEQNKAFQKGYNDFKEKAVSRLAEALGESFTPADKGALDTAINSITGLKEKVAEGIPDPTKTPEYQQIKGEADKWKQAAQTAEQEAERIGHQYTFDSTWGEAAVEIGKTAKFVIPQQDVKALFNTKYDVEYRDGKQVVLQAGQPLMEDGDYKPLSRAMIEFSKAYTEPEAGGSGGGTGGGGSVKPKYEDFVKATQAGDQEKADKLLAQFMESGEEWA